MGTTRESPQSIIGRLKALTTGKNKKDGVVVPADNVLSATTSARLDAGFTNYSNGIAAIRLAKTTYHSKVELARPERVLMKNNITGFYDSLNGLITRGKVPASARGYYGLAITNKKMPKMDTDVELLLAAETVLSGDILRVAAGGIAMSGPTIAEYTIVYDLAKPAIIAISNAHTAWNTATKNLKLQIPEIKDLITHIWDEAEAYYSMNTPTERRVECRLWGVRYVSTGVLSVVTGTVKDEAGVVIADVKVRIIGSSNSTLTDTLGHFSLNTSLYGDLEIEATHINYEKTITDFVKEDGVAMAVEVVMAHV